VSIVCICRVDVFGVFMSSLRICASMIQTYACICLFFNLRWRMYALRNIYIMMMHFFLGVNFCSIKRVDRGLIFSCLFLTLFFIGLCGNKER